MLKRTPLFETHQKLGGRLVEFGGWEMPVQYTSILDEHQAVRTAAGLFDISHMGEVLVTGHKAAAFLNHVLTNDIARLRVGHGQYTLLCNERGGVIDDLYAYCLAAREYLLVINASRIEADIAWLEQQLQIFLPEKGIGDVVLGNVSANMGAVAVQGPRVVDFINQCCPANFVGGAIVQHCDELKKNEIGRCRFDEQDVWVSRTGYTGEDGFEIIAPAGAIASIWNQLLEAGRPFGLKPCGLGARDTLRTEVCYPLYGQELNESTTPLEAGLGAFVALDKGEFIGRAALVAQKQQGIARRLVAFRMTGPSAPPRPHYPIWAAGARVGEVTSGTQSPSLGVGIGLGYVPVSSAGPDTALEIEIRGRRASAVVVKKPIYRK